MTDDISRFFASLELSKPRTPLSAPLRAIWHGLRGEWDAAHETVQAESDRNSAWVHAWLHRIEGDLPNARYWYGRAGREISSASTQDEAKSIATALIRKA
jgi:hypothetical protein